MMEKDRFDEFTRAIAVGGPRRGFLRGALGAAAMLALSRFGQSGVDARRGTAGAGDPCRHDDQCVAADTALYCDWNGHGHDGDLNCCAYAGSRGRCARGCCGYATCDGGWCNGDDGGGGSVSVGNGGYASADASGGVVSIGDINSGGNVGNIIDVGNTQGNVSVSGGYVYNDTSIDADASGGVAIADASAGSGNMAADSGGGVYVSQTQTNSCTSEGCWCWQGQSDDDPCDYGLVCCHQSSDDSGTCLSLYECTGYGAPGDACPAYCAPGAECPSCVSGYCSWTGYCG